MQVPFPLFVKDTTNISSFKGKLQYMEIQTLKENIKLIIKIYL